MESGTKKNKCIMLKNESLFKVSNCEAMIKCLFSFILISVSAFSQTRPVRKSEKIKPSAASLRAGAFIDVNVPPYVPSNYTPEQLVKNILINGGTNCTTANVTNVTVSPNHDVTNNNRFWGYFHKGTTSFPFTDGIVLTTGYASEAGNSYVSAVGQSVGTGSDASVSGPSVCCP